MAVRAFSIKSLIKSVSIFQEVLDFCDFATFFCIFGFTTYACVIINWCFCFLLSLLLWVVVVGVTLCRRSNRCRSRSSWLYWLRRLYYWLCGSRKSCLWIYWCNLENLAIYTLHSLRRICCWSRWSDRWICCRGGTGATLQYACFIASSREVHARRNSLNLAPLFHCCCHCFVRFIFRFLCRFVYWFHFRCHPLLSIFCSRRVSISSVFHLLWFIWVKSSLPAIFFLCIFIDFLVFCLTRFLVLHYLLSAL